MNYAFSLPIFFAISLPILFILLHPFVRQLKAKDLRVILKNAVALSLVISIILFAVSLLSDIPLVFGIYAIVGVSLFLGIAANVFRDRRGIGTSRRAMAGKALALVAFIILMGVWVGGYGALANANYYNGNITFERGTSLFANDTLPYNEIPVVSVSYASYIATSHLGDFGGNTKIYDNEFMVENSTPYWIFSVGSTNTIGTNHLIGFELVNAVNASLREIFQNTTIGAGLFFTHNINYATYVGNTQDIIGNHYPQLRANGEVDYVVTLDSLGPNGLQQFAGGEAFNPQGNIIAKWTSPGNAPSWVNQPWDKNLFQVLIHDWAGNRIGNGSFGFFAGGFLNKAASSYMMNVDNNSELIPYHNQTAYMQFLSPANAPNALSGVMLATGSHVFFYNLENLGLISAAAAKATIQAKLPALSGATYFTSNPILYPLGGYFAWIVPYYSQEASTSIVQLQGLGIVDAENSAHYVSIQSQFSSISSSGVTKLIGNAVTQFLSGNFQQQPGTVVNGTIVNITQFDQNGSTVVALELNNTQYYFASAALLNDSQIIQILQLQVGDNVSLMVQGHNILQATKI